MTFQVQTRSHTGKWKTSGFAPSSTVEAATKNARYLDEDGLFRSDMRIVDATGKVVLKGDNSHDPLR